MPISEIKTSNVLCGDSWLRGRMYTAWVMSLFDGSFSQGHTDTTYNVPSRSKKQMVSTGRTDGPTDVPMDTLLYGLATKNHSITSYNSKSPHPTRPGGIGYHWPNNSGKKLIVSLNSITKWWETERTKTPGKKKKKKEKEKKKKSTNFYGRTRF